MIRDKSGTPANTTSLTDMQDGCAIGRAAFALPKQDTPDAPYPVSAMRMIQRVHKPVQAVTRISWEHAWPRCSKGCNQTQAGNARQAPPDPSSGVPRQAGGVCARLWPLRGPLNPAAS